MPSFKKKTKSSGVSKVFEESCDVMNEDEIRDKLINTEQQIRLLKQEQKADEKLRAAKNLVKDLNSGYSSALRTERARIDFLINKLCEITGDFVEKEEQ